MRNNIYMSTLYTLINTVPIKTLHNVQIDVHISGLTECPISYRVSQKTWEFSGEFDIVFVMN